MGADEGAVVLEETEDTLSDLEGVGTAEMREPRERSGVPKDWKEESACWLSAADIVLDLLNAFTNQRLFNRLAPARPFHTRRS